MLDHKLKPVGKNIRRKTLATRLTHEEDDARPWDTPHSMCGARPPVAPRRGGPIAYPEGLVLNPEAPWFDQGVYTIKAWSTIPKIVLEGYRV